MTSPFTVLHVCMGNICRSPMAERLLLLAARERVGDRVDELLLIESAGTGGWHAGEAMNPPAAREVRRRGGDTTSFAARRLRGDHLDTADLVLTATAEQWEYVLSLRADAADRTFVLGEFGRLLGAVDRRALPAAQPVGAAPAGPRQPYAPQPDAVYARGVALVEAVGAARGGDAPRPEDDLDDPWGRGDGFFVRIGDEIEQTVRPLVEILLA